MKVVRDQLHNTLFFAARDSKNPQAAIKCAEQNDFDVNSGAQYLYIAVQMESAAVL